MMAKTVNNHELIDYNKVFNTSRDGCDYNTAPPDPSMHPLALYQPAPNINNSLVQNAAYHPTAAATTISTPSKTDFSDMNRENTLVTGYSPLDYGYGMTPVATAFNANDVNMAPFMDSKVNAQSRRRHSSVGEFFSGMMGRDGNNINNRRMSRSRTKDSSTVHTHRRSSISKFFSPGEEEHAHENLGRRRSSAYLSMGFKAGTDGDEHKGPYADVSRSQAQHMERVRETERKLGLTHNVDGLPLPKENTGQRHRSSVAHILGLDKKLLAF